MHRCCLHTPHHHLQPTRHRPLALPACGIGVADCRGPRRTAPHLRCTADAAAMRCDAGSAALHHLASASESEFPRPPRCIRQQLGRVAPLSVPLRSRRIARFQAKWCRDGRERDEQRWRRQSAAARRRRRVDRGNWHPRNPIPGPDGRSEHAIRRAQLTPLLRLCLPCSSRPCLRIRPCPFGGTHVSAPAPCPPLCILPFVPRCYSAPFIDQRTIARLHLPLLASMIQRGAVMRVSGAPLSSSDMGFWTTGNSNPMSACA